MCCISFWRMTTSYNYRKNSMNHLHKHKHRILMMMKNKVFVQVLHLPNVQWNYKTGLLLTTPHVTAIKMIDSGQNMFILPCPWSNCFQLPRLTELTVDIPKNELDPADECVCRNLMFMKSATSPGGEIFASLTLSLTNISTTAGIRGRCFAVSCTQSSPTFKNRTASVSGKFLSSVGSTNFTRALAS